MSKLFTGIAIMQLVEQGRIDLDAPVDQDITDFGYKTHFLEAGPLTVRTLMTHQSGLVGDIFKGWGSTSGPEHHFRELVEDLNEEYLAYPPGYISTYSNCAVALLGIVIEEVSGVEFKTYIQNNICRPLGMATSNFSLRDYMVPMLAKSYDSAGVESPFLYIRDEPAGSFISNALEMSLFMRMILNGGKLFGRRILEQATLEQMFVQQNGNVELDFPDDHGFKWGLSWVLSWPSLAYAGQYVGHSGGIPHYYKQMHILPEHGLAVIVETNSSSGDQLSADVADMAMIKALEIF
ncbi:beta-lactamase domain protein [Desulfosarcina variabilis str. Montpellier]